MKKTILLLILIPLFLHQESKAQHFIASFGVQHSWNVPLAITGQIYDHFYDYNWIHADRVWTPRGDDFFIVLQRNNLFVEVEIGWDGFIRHVEYFDYYPLNQHVCDDFCGFHQPFYNTFYNPNRFVFDYGVSYVHYRPRIRATYCHPFRFTRRPRFVNVYSPFRFRRNYTKVFRRVDHYDHSFRYGRNRTFHYRGNAQRAGRTGNYRTSNAGRSSDSRTYGDRTRTTTRQNNGRSTGRQSNVNRSTDRSVNRDINNRTTTGTTRQSTRSSSYNTNPRVSSGNSSSRSRVGSTTRSGNNSSYTPRSGTSRNSSVSRGNTSSRSSSTRTSPSRSTNRSSSVSRNSGSKSSSGSRSSVQPRSSRGSVSKSGSRSSGRSGSSSRSKSSSSRSRSRGN